MSNTITAPASSFNNGTSCHKINKLLRNNDRPRLSVNFYNKYEILRVVPISGSSLQPRASSSSSSSSSPAPSSSSPWKKWLLGFLLTVILPVAGHKGGLLLGLKGKIDEAVERVEHVAEVVEEMAEEAEKIVEEVEEKLPAGNTKLKEALESFEHLTKTAVIEAKKAEDIIHKVRDVEEEIEGVFLKAGNDQDKKE